MKLAMLSKDIKFIVLDKIISAVLAAGYVRSVKLKIFNRLNIRQFARNGRPEFSSTRAPRSYVIIIIPGSQRRFLLYDDGHVHENGFISLSDAVEIPYNQFYFKEHFDKLPFKS